jgi:hypothetical protein
MGCLNLPLESTRAERPASDPEPDEDVDWEDCGLELEVEAVEEPEPSLPSFTPLPLKAENC